MANKHILLKPTYFFLAFNKSSLRYFSAPRPVKLIVLVPTRHRRHGAVLRTRNKRKTSKRQTRDPLSSQFPISHLFIRKPSFWSL